MNEDTDDNNIFNVNSNNQQGGITAGIVNINSSPKPELLSERRDNDSLILIIGEKNGNSIKSVNGTINFETEVSNVKIGTIGNVMVFGNQRGQLSNDHLSYSFSSTPLYNNNYLQITITPFTKGRLDFKEN